MAVTKILAKRARLDVLVGYTLNGDKTDEGILTAYWNCHENNPYLQMKQTKLETGKTDGVQAYHIIQSFAKGEIQPEQALEIARQYVRECLPGYQAVIGTHIDRDHTHNHIVFNSVNLFTGKKYRSTPKTYFEQIRDVSDRLCREHGLSVIMRGESTKAVSYAEWLREQKGQPTFRGMLQADMDMAISDANDLGHFYMLMEHMGYEIKHGAHLAFRLRGQENFIRPVRRDARYTEEGIRAAIAGNLEAIEQGLRPVFVPRRPYTPLRLKGKLKGFLALYVHYLYVLGKIGKQQYPPRMTPHLKQEYMKFERYREQFRFLRINGIENAGQLAAYKADAETRLATLMKRRTILNVQKKKRRGLFDALADAEALLPAKELYVLGVTGIEDEFARYMDAVEIIEKSGIPREQLAEEKAGLYASLAEINREIRAERRNITLCDEIAGSAPRMEKEMESTKDQAGKADRDERGRQR